MASLCSLPDELLLMALGFRWPADKQEILALRATSATFNRLATPLIRVSIKLSIAEGYPEGIDVSRQQAREAQALTRSLARHPDCAGFVKEFKWMVWSCLQAFDVYKRPTMKSMSLPVGENLHYEKVVKLTGASSSVRRCLRRNLDKEAPDAHTALLLLACSDLEVLHVRAELNEHLSKLLLRMLKYGLTGGPNGSPRILRKLRDLQIGERDRCLPETQLQSVLPWLVLPCLERIEINGCYLSNNHHRPLLASLEDLSRSKANAWPENSVRKVSLTLDDCDFRGPALGLILGVVGRVTSLVVRWRSYWSCGRVTYAAIGNALRTHGKPLENLLFDPRAQYRHSGPKEEKVSDFGDLVELTSLRSLVIPQHALAGECMNASPQDRVSRAEKILPDSLEELYVVDPISWAPDNGVAEIRNIDWPSLLDSTKLRRLKKVQRVGWTTRAPESWGPRPASRKSFFSINHSSVPGLHPPAVVIPN